MKPVTLGSVYMDRGEGLEYLQGQVTRMATAKPGQYFIDIICRPDQLKEATSLLAEFYNLTAELIPSLKRTDIFASITCNDAVRPAAMALAMINKIEGSSYGFVDVNPTRKPR